MSSVTAGTIAPWAKGVEYARNRARTASTERQTGEHGVGLFRLHPPPSRLRETRCPRPTPDRGGTAGAYRLSREDDKLLVLLDEFHQGTKWSAIRSPVSERS